MRHLFSLTKSSSSDTLRQPSPALVALCSRLTLCSALVKHPGMIFSSVSERASQCVTVMLMPFFTRGSQNPSVCSCKYRISKFSVQSRVSSYCGKDKCATRGILFLLSIILISYCSIKMSKFKRYWLCPAGASLQNFGS